MLYLPFEFCYNSIVVQIALFKTPFNSTFFFFSLSWSRSESPKSTAQNPLQRELWAGAKSECLVTPGQRKSQTMSWSGLRKMCKWVISVRKEKQYFHNTFDYRHNPSGCFLFSLSVVKYAFSDICQKYNVAFDFANNNNSSSRLSSFIISG